MVTTENMPKNWQLKLDETLQRTPPFVTQTVKWDLERQISPQVHQAVGWRAQIEIWVIYLILSPKLSPLPNKTFLQGLEKGLGGEGPFGNYCPNLSEIKESLNSGSVPFHCILEAEKWGILRSFPPSEPSFCLHMGGPDVREIRQTFAAVMGGGVLGGAREVPRFWSNTSEHIWFFTAGLEFTTFSSLLKA